MFWIIFTTCSALLGGLAGWTLGEQPAALAFTIVGAFVAVGIRDLTRHKHAILSLTILVGTIARLLRWPGSGFGGSPSRLPPANCRSRVHPAAEPVSASLAGGDLPGLVARLALFTTRCTA
jgi:hypothetical protein